MPIFNTTQLPQKMTLVSKVVKGCSKIIENYHLAFFLSKSVTHSLSFLFLLVIHSIHSTVKPCLTTHSHYNTFVTITMKPNNDSRHIGLHYGNLLYWLFCPTHKGNSSRGITGYSLKWQICKNKWKTPRREWWVPMFNICRYLFLRFNIKVI